MNWRSQKAPVIVGAVLILGLALYTAVYRSSPGELTAAHNEVAGSALITSCNKCHAEKNVATGCLKCHAEIQTQLKRANGYHAFLLKGKPTECASCHSEHNGPEFQMINKVSWGHQEPSAFDHAHVKFRLSGKHQGLECNACHTEKNHAPIALPDFPKKIRKTTFLGLQQDCVSCHRDPHSGGQTTNCEACHDQKKFRPAVGFNHNKFFPLVGGHAKLKCEQCHAISSSDKNPKRSPFSIFGPVRGKTCRACHESPHRVDWKTRCETCHKGNDPSWATGFKRMTVAQHSFTSFKLVKPHDRVSCAKCHKDGVAFDQKPRPAARCELCHDDPHGGEFIKAHPRCTDCHGLSSFRPSKFRVQDHTIYPLIGGHEKASCQSCHRFPKGSKVRQYKGTTRVCADCHRDVHVGQFRQNGVTKCDSCHNSPISWKKLSFNHNKQARFALDEAHANIACAECHPQVTLKNGVKIIQYKPIRSRCEDCHSMEELR